MITVTINKKEEKIPKEMTVQALLESRDAKRMAVWINGSQLLMSEYSTSVIQDGDQIKLLRVVAGG